MDRQFKDVWAEFQNACLRELRILQATNATAPPASACSVTLVSSQQEQRGELDVSALRDDFQSQLTQEQSDRVEHYESLLARVDQLSRDANDTLAIFAGESLASRGEMREEFQKIQTSLADLHAQLEREQSERANDCKSLCECVDQLANDVGDKLANAAVETLAMRGDLWARLQDLCAQERTEREAAIAAMHADSTEIVVASATEEYGVDSKAACEGLKAWFTAEMSTLKREQEAKNVAIAKLVVEHVSAMEGCLNQLVQTTVEAPQAEVVSLTVSKIVIAEGMDPDSRMQLLRDAYDGCAESELDHHLDATINSSLNSQCDPPVCGNFSACMAKLSSKTLHHLGDESLVHA